MKKSVCILILFILLSQVSFPLFAGIILPEGTQIQLENQETWNSDMMYHGQNVKFRTLYDVIVNEKILIPSDTEVLAKVIMVEKKGILGKPGRFFLQIENVKAIDGTIVPISATHIFNGKGKQVEAIFVTLILCVFGIFIQGEDATINTGTIIEAYTLTYADIESNLDVSQKAIEENKKTVEVIRDMWIEVISIDSKSYKGKLSSKEDNKIHVLKENKLTTIAIKKILKIYDVYDRSEITEKVFEMEDFKPSVKYKWNSLDLKEID